MVNEIGKTQENRFCLSGRKGGLKSRMETKDSGEEEGALGREEGETGVGKMEP